MSDAQVPAPDAHLPAHLPVLPHMSLDNSFHEHDFAHADFEVHPSLSPLSMNPIPGGTLSRPASMASMTLPGQALSRVPSLSNLHQATWQPMLYAPMFVPSYSQNQGQQLPNFGTGQQNFSAGQYALNTSLGFPSMNPFFGDLLQPPAKTSEAAKPTKRGKPKKEKPVNSGADEPPSKQAKMQKSASKAADSDTKPPRSRNPSSVYRGVSKCSKDGRWQARIRVKRQVTYLGRFVNEVDAAKRYDEAARLHHGEKAILNFPTAEDKTLGRKQAASVSGGADDDDDDDDGSSD